MANANFISAWYNRGVGFHNEDYSTENWIFNSAMEAYTTKNIATFFLTPDGKVFHYVAGYYSPDVFLSYLQVALQVRQAAFDEKMQLKASGMEALRNVHGEVVKIISETEKKIGTLIKEKDGWKKCLADYQTYSYRNVEHKHTQNCANNLHEGYRYLTILHKHWSEVKELPDLEKVRYTYLWGNPFTEENPNSKPIGGGRGDGMEGRPSVAGKCGCD